LLYAFWLTTFFSNMLNKVYNMTIGYMLMRNISLPNFLIIFNPNYVWNILKTILPLMIFILESDIVFIIFYDRFWYTCAYFNRYILYFTYSNSSHYFLYYITHKIIILLDKLDYLKSGGIIKIDSRRIFNWLQINYYNNFPRFRCK